MLWLVTGGAGYVGGHVVRALRRGGHEVAVLDDLSTSDGRRVPAGVPLVRASVTDPGAVRAALARFGARGVVHLAARKDAAESVRDAAGYHETNVGGTVAVMEAMTAAGVRRLVFASSAAVYGEPPPGPVTEEAPLVPRNPYGETKVAAERALERGARAGALRLTVLRLFNVAGTGHPSLADRCGHSLLPLLLRSGRPLDVFGTDYPTADGSAVRDYVHVQDVAAAFLVAASALRDGLCGAHGAALARSGGLQAFNVGSGAGHSVLDVVEAVRRVTGRPVEVAPAERRHGDCASIVSDVTRIRNGLGWRPRRTLDDMVRGQWAATRPAGMPGTPGTPGVPAGASAGGGPGQVLAEGTDPPAALHTGVE